MPFISTALGIGLATAASAGIGAAASSSAAGKQASAADSAAQLQYQESQNALNENQRQFNITQQNEAPWLNAGSNAVSTLSGLIPQLNAQSAAYPSFTAPTAEDARNTPGYQFQLQQGEGAVDNGAAARGGLLSGNTLNAENQFGQGLADSTYNDTYNRALQTYGTNFNTFNTTQANQFNRYASLAGLGQTAANQLATSGQANANTAANINLTAGQQIGQNINNAGAATASGYVGASNAITGGLNNYSQLLAYMNQNQPVNPNVYNNSYDNNPTQYEATG